jgi:aryl-alcohol dehydrogenase-like predicted oxidoreductase
LLQESVTYINFTQSNLLISLIYIMNLIMLNGTDLNVSRACLGTMTFGSPASETQSQDILNYALDHGINFIDTANIYGNGASEEILGRAFNGRRQQFILASKAGFSMGEGPLDGGLSRGAMVKALEDTLCRLKTDYLDLYYLHQPDVKIPLEESLESLDGMIRSGKVRYAACSNYASWQVGQMQWIAEKNGYKSIRIAQPMYNLIARGIEPEFVPMAAQFGVAILAYNPLAGGLLTGKHAASQPANGSRFVKNQVYRDRYWNSEFLEAVDELTTIASRAGRSLISMAFNWLLHHTPTSCVIVGASRVEQLEMNLTAIQEGPLSASTVEECNGVWARLKGCTPQYNR